MLFVALHLHSYIISFDTLCQKQAVMFSGEMRRKCREHMRECVVEVEAFLSKDILIWLFLMMAVHCAVSS